MENSEMEILERAKSHAREMADKRGPGRQLGWREAQTIAGDTIPESLPRDFHKAYRKAYAERLVELGHARAPSTPDPAKPRVSGKHSQEHTSIKLWESRPGQFLEWREKAQMAGRNLSDWIRGVVDSSG